MVPPAAAASAALHGALLESRQRWQDLAGLGADLVFETDNAGRFTFLWPDIVLGHRAADLLGRRADSLLLGAAPNPFALQQALRGHRVWMADAQGQPRCLALSLAPLRDARGGHAGLRCAAHDVTAQEAAAASAAAGLRRAALLDALAESVRHAGTAREALDFGLAGLRDALGCAGTAMLVPADPLPEVAASHRRPRRRPCAVAPRRALAMGAGLARHAGRPRSPARCCTTMAARPPPARWPPGANTGGRDWDPEDLAVLRSMAAMMGAVLGFDRMQRELERQASTDPLTGLANRRAFLDALEARLRDVLDAPARYPRGWFGRARALSRPRVAWTRPGAMHAARWSFLDLDNLKPLNDRYGHEAGDAALRTTARLLRATAAPGDIAARFGGDEFILWIAGADEAAAIARARALLEGVAMLDNDSAPRFSLGIATWRPATREGVARLLARADAALYDAKRHGRGGWRLAEAPA